MCAIGSARLRVGRLTCYRVCKSAAGCAKFVVLHDLAGKWAEFAGLHDIYKQILIMWAKFVDLHEFLPYIGNLSCKIGILAHC